MKTLKSAVAASLVCVLGLQMVACDIPEPEPELERRLSDLKDDKTLNQACAAKIMQQTIDNFGMKSTKHKRRDVRNARMEIREKCRLSLKG